MYFIDPDGMQATSPNYIAATYSIDKKGEITWLDDEKYFNAQGEEIDKLIFGEAEYDENGNLLNESIDVKKDVIKDARELKTIDRKARKDKNIVIGYSLFFGNNAGNSRKVFEFLSKHVDVEYSFINIGDASNIYKQIFFIFTYKESLKERFGPVFALGQASAVNLIEHSHNHPLYNSSQASEADLKFKKLLEDAYGIFKKNNPEKQSHNPSFYIRYGNSYFPY